MGALIGGFLVLFGLIWTGVMLTVSRGTAHAGGPAIVGTIMHSMTGLGVVILVIGLFLLITGIIRAKAKRQKAMDIFQRGTLTKGTVTFVDKNYGLLVNNKPIFSIVEFTFQDTGGKTYTSRKDNVSSDLVIRDRIAVGSPYALKYLPENPGSNILLLQDPASNQPGVSA